jgi:hypothetical protein
MSAKRDTARIIGRTLYLVCVLGLAAYIAAAVCNVGSPLTASRGGAGHAASGGSGRDTRDLGTWRGTLPLARSVNVVDVLTVDGRKAPGDGVWAGQYDPSDGSITVISSAGDLTLAHEYGHALLHDLLDERMGRGALSIGVFMQMEATDRTSDSESVPEWLRGMFHEYCGLPADPYGDTYYGNSFCEYFAESFAWTANRDGAYVAPITLAFFTSLETAKD